MLPVVSEHPMTNCDNGSQLTGSSSLLTVPHPGVTMRVSESQDGVPLGPPNPSVNFIPQSGILGSCWFSTMVLLKKEKKIGQIPRLKSKTEDVFISQEKVTSPSPLCQENLPALPTQCPPNAPLLPPFIITSCTTIPSSACLYSKSASINIYSAATVIP